MGLESARSRSIKRFDNLLLIAALILFVLWCLGYAATMKKYNYSLQANTIKHRAVLSFNSWGSLSSDIISTIDQLVKE